MPMPWSATLSSALPSGLLLVLMTTRVFSGLYATAFSSRLRSAVTSRSSSPRTERPGQPTEASVMPRAFAFIRQRSTASATTVSSSTGRGSGTGSTAWILDSVMRSWTRLVSRCASWRILPANRLGVVGGVLDRLGQQGQRADGRLELVAGVGDEVPLDLVHPAALGLVLGEHQHQAAAADGGPQGGHPDREARRPAAEPGHGDLELAL